MRERSRERSRERNVRERSAEGRERGGERRGERERAKEYERTRENREKEKEIEIEIGRGRGRERSRERGGRDKSDMSISSYKISKSGVRGRAESPNWSKLAVETGNDDGNNTVHNGNTRSSKNSDFQRRNSGSELSHFIATSSPLLRFSSEKKDLMSKTESQKYFPIKNNSGEVSKTSSTAYNDIFLKSKSMSISRSMSMSRDTIMTGSTGNGTRQGAGRRRDGGGGIGGGGGSVGGGVSVGRGEGGGRGRGEGGSVGGGGGGKGGGVEVEKEMNNLAISLQQHPQAKKGANKIGKKGVSDFGYMEKKINENGIVEKKSILEKEDEYSKHSESKVRVPSPKIIVSENIQTEINSTGRAKGSYFKNFFARSHSPVSTKTIAQQRVRSVSPLNVSMMTNMSSNKVRENVMRLTDSHRSCVVTSPVVFNQRRHYEFE